MHFPIVLAFDADLKLYVSVWTQVYAIVVVFMLIKARSLFGFYRFCLHVALPKRYFGSCNGMMRYCREIGL